MRLLELTGRHHLSKEIVVTLGFREKTFLFVLLNFKSKLHNRDVNAVNVFSILRTSYFSGAKVLQ